MAGLANGRPQNSSVLPFFSLLTSHDVPTRLDASIALIGSLPLQSSSKQQEGDTPYAIKRLVNGLGSTNDAARQGYAVALTELLSKLDKREADSVLPLLLESTTVTNSLEGKEERALYFGRLLGFHALVRSGVVMRKDTDGESFKEVVQGLIALSNRKSWLKESAYWVIVAAIKSLAALPKSEAPSWRADVQAWLVQRLLNDPREKSRGVDSEKLAVILALQQTNVTADYATILAPAFKQANVLSKKSLPAVANVLKGQQVAEQSDKAPAEGANAIKTSRGPTSLAGGAPHFVWSEIFDIYFSDDAGAPLFEDKASWQDFWRVVVDQPLFGATSHVLKAIGFSLLAQAIQRLPPDMMPTLFSENVLRTLANHLRKTSDHEKTLAKTAEKLAASIPGRLSNHPTAVFPVLKALVGPPHGSPQFDAKTIERLVSKLDAKGLKSWISYLQQVVLTGSFGEGDEAPLAEDEQKILVSRRTWGLDQLLHVARTGSVAKDEQTLAGLLEFFAVTGWFDVRKSGKGARSYAPNPSLALSTREGARTRFYSICNALVALDKTWLQRAADLLDTLSADTKHFALVEAVEAETAILRKRLVSAARTLPTSSDDGRPEAVRALINGLVLLAYEDDEEMAENLEHAQDTLKALYPSTKLPTPAKAVASDNSDVDSEEGEAPEPTTVLMDLLLQLLRRPSAFVKTICLQAFSAHVDVFGSQAIELFIEQLRPEQALAKEEDVEMADADAADGEEADDDSSDDDDNDDGEACDVDVDEDFKNELLAALQESGVAYNGADESEDSDDDEEELLDDDQMMALDDKLADIFRQQNASSGKSKRAERMDDLHYRLRLIDLVELLEKQSSSPLLVRIVVPLIEIMRYEPETAKELRDKAEKLCRAIVLPKKKKATPEPATPADAFEALKALHALAISTTGTAITQLISSTGVYLAKAITASPGCTQKHRDQLAGLYFESFEAYLTQKNSKTKVQPALTLELCKRQPASAWPCFARIVALLTQDLDSSHSAIANAFRRLQAFEVAHTLLIAHNGVQATETREHVSNALPEWTTLLYRSLDEGITSQALDLQRMKLLARYAIATAKATRSRNEAAWAQAGFDSLVEKLGASQYKDAQGLRTMLKTLEKDTKAKGTDKKVNGQAQVPKVNGHSAQKRALPEDDAQVSKKPKKSKDKSKKQKQV